MRFLAHASTWKPGLGWGSVNYSGSRGDLYHAIKLFTYQVARQEQGGSARPSGAWVVSPADDYAAPRSRLGHWAGGAPLRAVQAQAHTVTVTDQQMNAKPGESPGAPDIGGHVLIPVPGHADRYYDLGAI